MALNYVWGNFTHFSFYGAFEKGEYCGDDLCNNNETYSSCPEDCDSQTVSTSGSNGGHRITEIVTTTSTTITSKTTTTIIETTILSNTLTTISHITTTSLVGGGPTGNIIKTMGNFSSTKTTIFSVILGLIILIGSLFFIKFRLLKKEHHNFDNREK